VLVFAGGMTNVFISRMGLRARLTMINRTGTEAHPTATTEPANGTEVADITTKRKRIQGGSGGFCRGL
jgi:hypothetical protein